MAHLSSIEEYHITVLCYAPCHCRSDNINSSDYWQWNCCNDAGYTKLQCRIDDRNFNPELNVFKLCSCNGAF